MNRIQKTLMGLLLLSLFCHPIQAQQAKDDFVPISAMDLRGDSTDDDHGAVAPFNSSSICPPCETSSSAAENPDYPSVKLTGFFHLDAGFYAQDAANILTLGDINDGLGFRRARLAAQGEVNENTSYILELDIAQSQARFVDVWMQLNETRLGKVRIGRFRQPFGMSGLTSARELPFLERPLIFALSPFRQTGVMLFDQSEDEKKTWAISGYRYISDNFGNVFSDSGGYGLSSRFTRIGAEWSEDHLWHLGADYSFNTPGRGVVQFAYTNELFLGQNPLLGPGSLSVLPIEFVPPFVNTGPIAADYDQFFNLESALALGRIAIQSEVRWASVKQTAGITSVFPSAYVQARYMLTGEKIPYSKSNGTFGRIVPACPLGKCGGGGAWELSGRVSYIDFNGTGIPGPGRRLTDFTVGCNWYWSKNAKLQFNWINSQLDDPTLGNSVANAFALRAQLDF